MSKNFDTELTNMIMIEDKDGRVLVQKRIKNWKGIAFPGGHIEKGESITDSVIREAKEETGLTVKNPRLCGIIHWDNRKKREKYMVFAYKATEFEGKLLDATDEGSVFWVTKDELSRMELCDNFDRYLKVFMQGEGKEFFDTYE